VSEPDEPGLDELERQLQAAFTGTRPRRGFEDELWARLWRRGAARPSPRPGLGRALAALGGLATLLLAGLLLVLVHPHPGGGASSGASAPTSRSVSDGQAAFGLLPRPAGSVAAPAGARAGQTLPAASAADVALNAGIPSPPPGGLPVYRYVAAAGPAGGTVLDPAQVEPGLPAASYPARSPAEVVQAARSAAAPPVDRVTVTGWRLVYVAVPDGPVGFLEPAYELTGTAQAGTASSPFRVVVPAVADSALR
jgi:hypothetical protein